MIQIVENNENIDFIQKMYFTKIKEKLFNHPLDKWNTSKVTDAFGIFWDAYTFNQDIDHKLVTVNETEYYAWDVSKVSDFWGLFYNAEKFNGKISNWKPDGVNYYMAYVFAGAASFNQDISNWFSNTSGRTLTFTHMFVRATAFNQDLSNWNMSNAVNMVCMFSETSSFNGDISNWDVTNVTNMNHMFAYASAFNKDISSWDVSNVTSGMDYMFYEATAFLFGETSTEDIITGHHGFGKWLQQDLDDDGEYLTLDENGVLYLDQESDELFVKLPHSTSIDMLTGATLLKSIKDNINKDGSIGPYKATITITLVGDEEVYQERTTPYTDAGATAIDNVNTPIKVFTSETLDVNTLGRYTITYTASSTIGLGKTETATRTVIVVDTLPPTMTITSRNVSSGTVTKVSPIVLTFTSSERTTDFTVDDITVTNGTLSILTSSNQRVYTAIFTPTADGLCTVNVAADSFTDLAGNGNTAATPFTWTYDSTPPTMEITSTTVTSGTASNDSTIDLTFTSTEATTSFTVSDITVSTNGSLSNFTSTSTTVYTATLTPTTDGVYTCLLYTSDAADE